MHSTDNIKKYTCVKRILDIVFSSVLLLIFLVPFLFIAAIVYIDDPGPVLFTQYRTGRYGEPFKLYKIRTLRLDAPRYAPSQEMKKKSYVTRVGKVLRNLSIDELPQLINVLRGDMSMVGPRPVIAKEHEIHDLRQKHGVYEIRPGLTGLAQINGRDELSPEEKVQLDVQYVTNYSFLMDVKIIISTIPIVLKGERGEKNTK